MLTKVLNTIRDLFTSRWIQRFLNETHWKDQSFALWSLDWIDLHVTTQQKYFLNCAAANLLIGLNWCTVRNKLWAVTTARAAAQGKLRNDYNFSSFSPLFRRSFDLNKKSEGEKSVCDHRRDIIRQGRCKWIDTTLSPIFIKVEGSGTRSGFVLGAVKLRWTVWCQDCSSNFKILSVRPHYKVKWTSVHRWKFLLREAKSK